MYSRPAACLPGKLANSNPPGGDNFADGNPDGVLLRQPYRAVAEWELSHLGDFRVDTFAKAALLDPCLINVLTSRQPIGCPRLSH